MEEPSNKKSESKSKIKSVLISFYFLKLNSKKIEEKIDFWSDEAQKIRKHIDSKDKVWLNWWNMLQAFKDNMKWASKLANEQFKKEHFIELFSAIGLNFDVEKNYTLQELIDLNFDEHAELITRIYKRALTELKLNQQFTAIENLWTNKLIFNLAKHFPINIYKTGSLDTFRSYLKLK